ncbi:VOC family protein [Phyllobacterium sp. BT25]|uniref:VOC family protein n=1 Tax=Phyllobacterium pellucidum TaxID=2740464 RepID=A0A849VJ25_9HYPH|nr:VOC family protein [Phyllobacterium pellucidum]NTS30205.1 VOC family protein [Phyllobacterium pellucidum]
MLHHISFGVPDMERASTFYDAALTALGYVRVWEDLTPNDPHQAIGYGLPGGGDKFCIKLTAERLTVPWAGCHLAFAAPNRQAVVLFHQAGIVAGGRDNGAPGLRPHYGENYFASYLIDPNGYHLEAICKSAE